MRLHFLRFLCYKIHLLSLKTDFRITQTRVSSDISSGNMVTTVGTGLKPNIMQRLYAAETETITTL